jgi:capsule polysaccharide modification protein KpsS
LEVQSFTQISVQQLFTEQNEQDVPEGGTIIIINFEPGESGCLENWSTGGRRDSAASWDQTLNSKITSHHLTSPQNLVHRLSG